MGRSRMELSLSGKRYVAGVARLLSAIIRAGPSVLPVRLTVERKVYPNERMPETSRCPGHGGLEVLPAVRCGPGRIHRRHSRDHFAGHRWCENRFYRNAARPDETRGRSDISYPGRTGPGRPFRILIVEHYPSKRPATNQRLTIRSQNTRSKTPEKINSRLEIPAPGGYAFDK